MNGKEFQIIRRYNKLTQVYLASLFGYTSKNIIVQLERQEIVPERFIKVLAQQADLEFEKLLDDDWLKEYVAKIPQRFKERKIFDPLLASNTNKVILNDLSMIRKRKLK